MDFSNSIVETLNSNVEGEAVNEKLATANEFLLKESKEEAKSKTEEEEDCATTKESEEDTKEDKKKENKVEENEEANKEATTETETETKTEEEEEDTKDSKEEEDTKDESSKDDSKTEEEEEIVSTETDNFKKFINDETSNESITDKIAVLIEEAKKREASKEERPNFYEFLNPTDIQAFENVSNEQQEEIKIAINESTGYYSRHDVTAIMKQVLEADKMTDGELLIQSMPEEIKQVWENLDDKYKSSVLAQSKLYDISSEQLCEHFWNTRKLEKYVLNEGKTLIASENPFDRMNQLSDEQVKSMTDKFKNL